MSEQFIRRPKSKNLSKSANEEVLLGIDYGDSNIGLAFGRAGFAMPLKVISAKDTGRAIKEIGDAALENRVSKLIIGLPLDGNEKETVQSKKTRQFANLLKVKVKIPIEYLNEHNTTKESVEEAIASGVSQKGRQSVDHISAALILKRYYREKEELDI